jgi:WD40 repeat protein
MEADMSTLTRTRSFILLTLIATALFLAACGQPGEDIDTGPNAGLSNDELLKLAMTNMKAAKSYHFEFRGGLPSESVQMSANMSIRADIQLDERGSKIKMADDGQVEGGPYTMLGMGTVGIDVLITKDGWYESYDAGKTWGKVQGDTGAGFLMGMFGWVWNDFSSSEGTKYPTMGEQMVKGLTFKDSTPRLERVDDTLTRHMVADFNSANSQPEGLLFNQQWEGAKTIDLWVSTEVSPTIRQMRVEGSNVVKKNQIGPINAIAVSPDSKRIATAHGHAEDWTVRVWDVAKPGNAPKKLSGKDGPFQAVAFSPDGKLLAAGVGASGGPTQLYIWDMENLDKSPLTLPVPSSVSSLAFRSDGKMLGAGTYDGVYLWEPPYTGAKPMVLSRSSHIDTLAFSPDNHTLATGGIDTGVRIYDVRNPADAPRELPYEWVDDVAFSQDGHLLAAIGGFQLDRSVKIWDLRKPDAEPTTFGDKKIPGTSLAFSPDGKVLATVGLGNVVQLWEVDKIGSSEASTKTISLGERDGGTLRYSPDGKWLLMTNYDNQVVLYDLQNPKTAPMILKEDEQPTETSYNITWKWSRFNEDFGEVKAPPTETVKSP